MTELIGRFQPQARAGQGVLEYALLLAVIAIVLVIVDVVRINLI